MSKEFKRMQKLAGVNEIKVNNPVQLYSLSPLAKRVVDKDWEDLRSAYHEGIAEAASILKQILDLNNKDYQSKYITSSDIEKYKKSIEPWAHNIDMGMDEWDGTTEFIINFLKDEGFLENKN